MNYWMGDTQTFEEASLGMQKAVEAMARPEVMARMSSSDSHSPYLSIVDNVGLVTVSGALVDGTWGEVGSWFGITGYGDVIQALTEAVKSADVKSILLVVKSGGGAVSSVAEVTTFIEQVDKVKPVVAYTPSVMGSAALWLGLAARETYASKLAVVGSIGTITVLRSEQRLRSQNGIDEAVLRSGEFKALGHVAEPITDEAKDQHMRTIVYMSDMFVTYASSRRKMPKATFLASAGSGQTFVGQQAVDVGLVDKVMTYSEAFAAAKGLAKPDKKANIAAGSVGASASLQHNPGKDNTEMKPNPPTLTSEQLLAIAAGLPEDPEPATTQPAATDKPAEQPKVDQPDLTAELATANSQLAEVRQQLQAATQASEEVSAKATDLNAQLADAAAVVTAAAKSMAVALNLDTAVFATLSPAEAVAKHAEISALFKTRFKLGRVSAEVLQTEPPKAEAQAVNPLFAAAAAMQTARN